ncbi:hypothetical protein BH09PSE2_BH09PSE2_24080 [soil metagenome]
MRTVLRKTLLIASMAGGAAVAGSAAAQSYGVQSYGAQSYAAPGYGTTYAYAPSHLASSGYGQAYARPADVRYGEPSCETTTTYGPRTYGYDSGRVTYSTGGDSRFVQTYEAPRYGQVQPGWTAGYAYGDDGYMPPARQAYGYGAYSARGY